MHLTQLVLSFATRSNENLLLFILTENLDIFVPGTTAKQILSLNHRNRKDVGGKHNVLVHYVNASAPNLFDVLFCNPFKWHILLFISDQKSCYICSCNSSEKNFIPQLQKQKSGRREAQWSNTLCECLCTWPSWVLSYGRTLPNEIFCVSLLFVLDWKSSRHTGTCFCTDDWQTYFFSTATLGTVIPVLWALPLFNSKWHQRQSKRHTSAPIRFDSTVR